MQWDIVASIATVVSAAAVVASVAYLAAQVRLNSTQIAQNSKHIEASIYHLTNEAFVNWYALIAQDSNLAALWQRVIKGETIDGLDKIKLHALLSILFLAAEANYRQEKLNVLDRRTLEAPAFRSTLILPAVSEWWREQGPRLFTSGFREIVDRFQAEAQLENDGGAKSA